MDTIRSVTDLCTIQLIVNLESSCEECLVVDYVECTYSVPVS